MARIQIELLPEEASGLSEIARTNLRNPREQLRFMLREELQRRGLLYSPQDIERDDETDDKEHNPEP
jgi:hypothetical protein